MEQVFAVVLAYLVGSIDFGVIVPKLMGVDIYEHGSGNPGTSNVLRAMGKKTAAIVMVGDALKGLGAAAIGGIVGGTEVAAHAAGFAAVVGHAFPVWHRFRGGRGVATAIGAAIWLEPWFGLAVAVVWAAVVAVTKTASVASLGAMAVFVPGFAIGGTRGRALVWVAAMSALVIARHKDNIRRIVEGSERTVSEP